MRGWTKSGAFQDSLCFVCGYVARKKKRKKERVFPSSFTLLFLSFCLLLYTFVIYNAEKRKKCVQFLSLSLRSADKTYIVYLVLRYSVYFANYENSAFVRVCVCV